MKERFLIAGGGAAKTKASLRLRELSIETTGMDSHCFCVYTDALQVIPNTLAENVGLKPIEIVTELRKAHVEGNVGAGIDVKNCSMGACRNSFFRFFLPFLAKTFAK